MRKGAVQQTSQGAKALRWQKDRPNHKVIRTSSFLELEAAAHRQAEATKETKSWGNTGYPIKKQATPVSICSACSSAYFNRFNTNKCEACQT